MNQKTFHWTCFHPTTLDKEIENHIRVGFVIDAVTPLQYDSPQLTQPPFNITEAIIIYHEKEK